MPTPTIDLSTNIGKVRAELGDIDINFPILSDDEINYFLEKNYSSITKASIDAAKTILFKLSMEDDAVIGILSLKGRAAAESYRLALELFLKNSALNPLFSNASVYAGGISQSDMLSYQTLDSTIKTFEF